VHNPQLAQNGSRSRSKPRCRSTPLQPTRRDCLGRTSWAVNGLNPEPPCNHCDLDQLRTKGFVTANLCQARENRAIVLLVNVRTYRHQRLEGRRVFVSPDRELPVSDLVRSLVSMWKREGELRTALRNDRFDPRRRKYRSAINTRTNAVDSVPYVACGFRNGPIRGTSKRSLGGWHATPISLKFYWFWRSRVSVIAMFPRQTGRSPRSDRMGNNGHAFDRSTSLNCDSSSFGWKSQGVVGFSRSVSAKERKSVCNEIVVGEWLSMAGSRVGDSSTGSSIRPGVA